MTEYKEVAVWLKMLQVFWHKDGRYYSPPFSSNSLQGYKTSKSIVNVFITSWDCATQRYKMPNLTGRMMFTIRNRRPEHKRLTCTRYRSQEDQTGTASQGKERGKYLNDISTARLDRYHCRKEWFPISLRYDAQCCTFEALYVRPKQVITNDITLYNYCFQLQMVFVLGLFWISMFHLLRLD